jgi:hypothetical protein
LRSISRIVARAATVATAVGAAAALCGSPASAAGGYWAKGCDPGRACIFLAEDYTVAWNFVGCGYHPVQDFYTAGQAHGNPFNVTYVDGRWDRIEPWTSRGLDFNNLVTRVDVLC